MKTKISEVLRKKGNFILTTEPSTPAIEALREMEDYDVGSILVADEDDLYGIFSERDYARRIALHEENTPDTPVEQVMTSRLAVVEPDYTVDECMAIMTAKRIRHLPVMDDDKLVGIVSIGDCVKRVSKKAKSRVKHLERYISGEYPG